MPVLSSYEKDVKTHLKNGQSMAALRVAEAAVKEHHQTAAAHYLHACVQESTARYEEALHSFRRTISLGGHADAETRAEVLATALERPHAQYVPTGLRSWKTALSLDALMAIQNALHNYQYKGVNLQKNPFDYALYPKLIWELKPKTIIEIGSKEGGSALWMADLCDTFKLDCHIHSIDIVKVATVKHKRVTFYEGDGRAPGDVLTEKFLKKLPRPWLVIEDADHSYETSMAVLDFFEDKLELTDVLVMEDGIISELSQMPEGGSGPHRALKKFLQRNFVEWEIIPEWCDFFGYNLTWNSNGFLRRTGLKKLGAEVAPELTSIISKIKAKEFQQALTDLAALGKVVYGREYLRAYCLWRLEQHELAITAIQEELKQHPQHAEAMRFAHFLKGKYLGTQMMMRMREGQRLAKAETLHLLNLGCGKRYHAAWLNMDYVPAHASVMKHDLNEPLPLEDASCSVVYHSHVLEHLTQSGGKALLKECERVLAPGGTIRIAVPDLEGIVREYLRTLEAGDHDKHEWMTMELIDQLTRHHSGGQMLQYWKQNPMPAEDLVLQRMGHEVGDFIAEHRTQAAKAVKQTELTAASVGQFRLGGEVHQWMYDRLSLQRVLRETGFINIRACGASESAIPQFSSYCLDTDEAGVVRKPDSLFMEATKPHQS
jgi:cephalosporin hydroxylase/predicted SAM-dependent methyltransferase